MVRVFVVVVVVGWRQAWQLAGVAARGLRDACSLVQLASDVQVA